MSILRQTALTRRCDSVPSGSGPVRHHTRGRPFRAAWSAIRTLLVVGAFLVVGMQTPALAAYPPAGCALAISTTSVAPGHTVTVSGCGLLPGSVVTITLEPSNQVLATVTVDASGAFSATVTIPSNLALGTYSITATGTAADGSPLSQTTSLTVAAASTSASSGPFGVTGSNVWPSVLVGGGLFLVGAMLIMTVRRRGALT